MKWRREASISTANKIFVYGEEAGICSFYDLYRDYRNNIVRGEK